MREIVISLGDGCELNLKVTDRFDEAVRKTLSLEPGAVIQHSEYRRFLGILAEEALAGTEQVD